MLMYPEQRTNDINKIKDPININEIEIYDEMKFFKYDAPAHQIKAGVTQLRGVSHNTGK